MPLPPDAASGDSHPDWPAPADITAVLQRWSLGDLESLQHLLPMVYEELRGIARAYMNRERPGHTLEPTGLVHETFLRLVRQPPQSWNDRRHFYGVASRLMRQILIDYARRRSAAKRDSETPEPTAPHWPFAAEFDADYISLDHCLTALEKTDARKAGIVEMRFFGGLELEEIAEATQLSVSGVKKQITVAKVWLFRCLKSAPPA